MEVVREIVFYFVEDGVGEGGLEGGDDGGVFGLLSQGGKVSFKVVEDMGSLRVDKVRGGKSGGWCGGGEGSTWAPLIVLGMVGVWALVRRVRVEKMSARLKSMVADVGW